jgi:hypothetical protein
METGFIKKIEKCVVENCFRCSHCGAMNSQESRTQVAEIKSNSELYNREAEQYYFYFQVNKAS